jgi:hypothetical protein
LPASEQPVAPLVHVALEIKMARNRVTKDRTRRDRLNEKADTPAILDVTRSAVGGRLQRD